MSRRKILLADDSITIQKVVNLTFAEEGIDVVTVGDGDSALARIGEEWPDLVMADVNMPGANGYQICEAIRSDKATRDIPVILLVGSFEPFDEAEAQRVGANTYLTKPFTSIRQLVAKVSELIAARPEPTAVEPTLNGIATEAVENETAEDIESLYEKSVSPEAELRTGGEAELEDEAFDDEMIETTYIDPKAETVEFSVVEDGGQAEGGHQWAEKRADGFETPLPQEAALGYAEPINSAETSEQMDHVEPPHYEERQVEAVSEEPAFGSGSMPGITEMPTEQFDVEEAGLSAFGPVTEHAPSDEMGGTAVQAHMPEAVKEPPVEEVFDDLSILDLPPMGDDTSIRFVTQEEAAAAGTKERAVSVSPELMDEIVSRVIERMAKTS